jgi:hypothetical protein
MNLRFSWAGLLILTILATSGLVAHMHAPRLTAGTAGQIVPTGQMAVPRFDHTATLLPNGKVLIVAGMARNGQTEPTAELYDPHGGRFSLVGKLTSPRGWGSTATLLNDGTVLITGGASGSWCSASCYLATAELYDPATNTFTRVGDMTEQRAGAQAILLQNGDVLIVGGNLNSGNAPITTAELYHPSTRIFSRAGSMPEGIVMPLKDGKLLFLRDSGADLYNPSTGRITSACNFSTPSSRYGAALLPNSKVLLVGGQVDGASGPQVNTTEIYAPAACKFAAGPEMSSNRFKLRKAIVPLANGRILIAGGSDQPEVYDPASNSFLETTGARIDTFYFSTATQLANGEVLIVGGYAQGGGPASNHAWLYKPANGQ